MFRGILITVLSLGIAGTALWGYQEHREKNAILINAENNYQRAFHDLTYQVDLLHDKIGATLAMNSRQSLSPTLADVWRITSQAHSDVGQLPLTLLPFNKTEEFLAKIGDFSYKVAVRDLDKDPLNDEEYATLKSLYGQAAGIQDELRNVQYMAMKNNLRWMDVELALASGTQPADNTIIDGFKTVEKTVGGYDETDLGPAFVNLKASDNNLNHLEGENISEKEAIKIAEKYIGLGKDTEVKITKSGKGSDYEFYSISMDNKKTKQISNMDITKKGGYPLWYVLSRDVKEQKISLNEAGKKATQFLLDNEFKDIELIESTQYDNLGVFTIIKSLDGVRIYPKAVKVKVALDNGQILGFSNDDYLKAVKSDTEIAKPTITLEEARAKINPQVKVMEDRLAIIMNDLGKAVLCYEFMGTLDKDTYRIFINADSGMEEKVEKMNNVEPLYEKVV
ncbi:germination protein YpeB [Bacillus sp. V3B]|uniref:germination protein YpeB n=1 Tax=Bacillus sp. V3B TaxID=2804915 RepID=UPI00210868E6|nr:germination protein YpeB [Bacillus sp. V3B]MCQ6273857.1 germination protein YpeB [Bacillus sp. V3B]